MFRLISYSLLFLLCSCATQSLRVVQSNDEVSQVFLERWQPSVDAALAVFDQRMLRASGRRASEPVQLLLARNAAEQEAARKKQPGGFVVNVTQDFPSMTHLRVVTAAVALRCQSLSFALAGGRLDLVPDWFELGVALQSGHAVVRSLQEPLLNVDDLEAEAETVLRDARDSLSLEDFFSAPENTPASTERSALSSFVMRQLQQRTGERFESAWTEVMKAAAGRQFLFESAFKTAFGVSLRSFRQEAQTALSALLAQSRQHAAPLPPANAAIAVDDLSKLPYQTEEFIEDYKRFLAAPAPKAFVYASPSLWVWRSDTASAMDWSLRLCRSIMVRDCKLYAVDAYVVRDAALPPVPFDVVMLSEGKDAWTQQVKERWLPVVQQSVEQFLRVTRERFEFVPNAVARIHVVTSNEDYQRLLREKFWSSRRSAQRTAEHSDGLANANGQIAVVLLSGSDDDRMWERTSLLVLHELAHEMQHQLSGSQAGFTVPRWISEGSAEQIAWLIAAQMPREASAPYAIGAWRDKCVDWYKAQGAQTMKPEDVLDRDFDQWLQLIAEDKQPYQMSGLMLEFLRERLGDAYYPRLLQYLRLAAGPDMQEAEAFSQSFGLTHAVFMSELKRWLASL